MNTLVLIVLLLIEALGVSFILVLFNPTSDFMKGGKDGAVIVPGDSANSLLFQIQSSGKHFANLSADELAVIKKWIDSGAPEK